MPHSSLIAGPSQPVGIARARSGRAAAVAAAAIAIALPPLPARAVDGCLVLLCLAAPSWRAIPQCVSPVRQVLHDLARGKPFPTCAMSGAGNTAGHRWSSAPAFCPPQYTIVIEDERAPSYHCLYVGAVSVTIDGALWARTWWNFAGDTVTEFTPAAKAQIGHWDPRFDDELAAWLAAQPAGPTPTPCHDC